MRFTMAASLRIQHEVAIRPSVVAKEMAKRNGDLSVCKTLPLTPDAVLGDGAGFFLCEGAHDGNQQLALGIQRPDVFFSK
jgi:hypothetical protein